MVEVAPASEFEQHRTALRGHCYRMLGSAVDADDAVQETMLRAWRSLDTFEGRASLKTWLFRVATHVCLDALADRAKRARPLDLGPCGGVDGPFDTLPRERWIEPIADAEALPAAVDPGERLAKKQTIRLAFVAALQHLTPMQRAALLLTDVVGWSPDEVATRFEVGRSALYSSIQRARAALADRDVARDLSGAEASLSPAARALVEGYVAAFERYDVDALTSLLHHDVTMCMPPYTLWLRGPETVRRFWLGPGAGCRGSRLVAVEANGAPAFAQYRASPEGGHHAWALVVLDVADDGLRGITSFLDVARIFSRFGLPLTRTF
jgi:RNA polymerase sigma-70 factor (ECF subfamily)